MARDVVVLKTGKLHEADLVANTFDEAGIPYYRGYETFTGLKLAMPLSPAQGPGENWVINVSEASAAEARAAIDALRIPSDMNPGVWDFAPAQGATRIYQGTACLMLAVLAVVLVLSLSDWFGR